MIASKFKNIKTPLLILTLLVGQVGFAQKQKVKTQSSDNFYFYYSIAGLGSNLGSFQPTLRVNGNKFIYTKEQNTYLGKRSKKVESISKGFLQRNSIDSILSVLKALKDTTIYRVNPCIMSGVIIYIIIVIGGDTTKFTLHNTFDLTALKILNILNSYLPRDKKLYGSELDIKEEEDCWIYLKGELKNQNEDCTK